MNRVAAFAAAALMIGSPEPAARFTPRVVAAGETAVLVFTGTAGFRHDSIPDAIAAVRRIGSENGFSVDATEDPSAFTDANLAPYRAVLFLLTTGDVLGDEEQASFERWVRAGGGWVGAHLTGAIRWAAGLAPGYCGNAGRETPRRAVPRRPPPRVVTPRE